MFKEDNFSQHIAPNSNTTSEELNVQVDKLDWFESFRICVLTYVSAGQSQKKIRNTQNGIKVIYKQILIFKNNTMC